MLLGHTLYELFHSLKMSQEATEDDFVFTSYSPFIFPSTSFQHRNDKLAQTGTDIISFEILKMVSL